MTLKELLKDNKGQFNLLGGLLPGMGGVPRTVGAGPRRREGGLGNPRGFGSNPSKRDLNTANFFTADTGATIRATTGSEFGAFTVGAEAAYRYGFGSAGGGLELNQGIIFAEIRESGDVTRRQGILRLSWKDPNRNRREVIKDFRTETLDGSKTNSSAGTLLPEIDTPTASLNGNINAAIEDQLLALEMIPDVDQINISSTTTGTDIIIPTTQYFR